MTSLSIIIPARNSEQHIRECVISILDQSFEDFEVLVVDDGSHDQTPSILEELCSEDQRVRGYTLEGGGKGAAFARKFGAHQASGTFVHFVDSDDRVARDCYQTIIPMLLETGADSWVFGYQEFWDGNKTCLPKSAKIKNQSPSTVVRPEDLEDDIFLFTNPAMWNKIWRRQYFHRFAAEFSMDLIIANDLPYTYAAIAGSRQIGVSSMPLYEYRVQKSGSLSSGGAGLAEITTALSDLRTLLGPLPLTKEFERSLNTLATLQLYQALLVDREIGDPTKSFEASASVIFESWFSNGLARDSFATTGSYLFIKRLKSLIASRREHPMSRPFFPFHPYGTLFERLSRKLR